MYDSSTSSILDGCIVLDAQEGSSKDTPNVLEIPTNMNPEDTNYRIEQEIFYRHDAATAFRRVCRGRTSTLLLEFVPCTYGIVVACSALRISAIRNTVYVQALTSNGQFVLSRLDAVFPKTVTVQRRVDRCTVRFPSSTNAEDERTHALSVFDGLRMLWIWLRETCRATDTAFFGGLFAYDLALEFESVPRARHPYVCPDYCFYVSEIRLTIDQTKRTCRLQGSVFDRTAREVDRVARNVRQIERVLRTRAVRPAHRRTARGVRAECGLSDREYWTVVRRIQRHVRAGEAFQVVPSRQFFLPCASPSDSHRILRRNDSSPYMFYMQDACFALFGSSPESSLSADAETRTVKIRPVAGTHKRGRRHDETLNVDLDDRIESALLFDSKETSEHVMLVDLARNDLARVCVPGTRRVSTLMRTHRCRYVMHLVSEVVGQLRRGLDIFHAYRACMNMGTLSGAPKIRAMEIIARYEDVPRGSFGGSLGYFTSTGELNTCIVIRSAYVQDNVATVQSGVGVVLDSLPTTEVEEGKQKARSVLDAISSTHFIRTTRDGQYLFA